jgi:hypothetical protein
MRELSGALHGEFVVQNSSGGYVTEALQTGKVTAISATSITVASADGYTKVYVLGSSTTVDNGADKISSVVAGHTVTVLATVSGSGDAATATATAITDQNLAGSAQNNQNNPPNGEQGNPPAGGQP